MAACIVVVGPDSCLPEESAHVGHEVDETTAHANSGGLFRHDCQSTLQLDRHHGSNRSIPMLHVSKSITLPEGVDQPPF